MIGEYAVKSQSGEWLIFRVSEAYARKFYEKNAGSVLYRVEGRDLRATPVESSPALLTAA